MAASPGHVRDRSIAALATLQPGIEPVFLVLLTTSTGLPPDQYGWVVGAGQIGMAAGSMACWRGGVVASRGAALAAALIAVAASLAMVEASGLSAIAALRAIFGLCVGLIYTRSAGAAARVKPDHAFGTIFLIQLLLSTVVTALLPLVADAVTPASAVRLLALCPAAIFLLVLTARPAAPAPVDAPAPRQAVVAAAPSATAAAVALFLFICVTMMVWSYVGAMGSDMGLSDAAIGMGVAIGSFCGVAPAIVASIAARKMSAAAIGLLCGAAMMTPLLAFAGGLGRPGFIASMCLFNIGSTFAIIRFAGLAVGANAPLRRRRLVAALHCLGMAAGPLVAATAVGSGGVPALAALAAAALVVAIATLFVADARRSSSSLTRLLVARAGGRPAPTGSSAAMQKKMPERRRIALD